MCNPTADNSLTGTIPSEIKLMTNLKKLNFGRWLIEEEICIVKLFYQNPVSIYFEYHAISLFPFSMLQGKILSLEPYEARSGYG